MIFNKKDKPLIKPINRNKHEPLFSQVKTNLQSMILQKKLKPGSKIYNEDKLCKLFNVSRITIRRAILELIKEGVLYRDHPKGTFVAKPKLKLNFIGELKSFAQEIISKDLDLTDKVMVSKTIRADSFISDKLNIAVGEEVYNILRLRSIGNSSISLVNSYINSKLCPNLDINKHKKDSLYSIIKKEYGLSIVKASRCLEPVIADKIESEILGIKVGAPMLLIRSISYLKDGSALEYYEAKIRGDRSILTLEIKKSGTDYIF